MACFKANFLWEYNKVLKKKSLILNRGPLRCCKQRPQVTAAIASEDNKPVLQARTMSQCCKRGRPANIANEDDEPVLQAKTTSQCCKRGRWATVACEDDESMPQTGTTNRCFTQRWQTNRCSKWVRRASVPTEDARQCCKRGRRTERTWSENDESVFQVGLISRCSKCKRLWRCPTLESDEQMFRMRTTNRCSKQTDFFF